MRTSGSGFASLGVDEALGINIGVFWGLDWGYIGIMEKKVETTNLATLGFWVSGARAAGFVLATSLLQNCSPVKTSSNPTCKETTIYLTVNLGRFKCKGYGMTRLLQAICDPDFHILQQGCMPLIEAKQTGPAQRHKPINRNLAKLGPYPKTRETKGVERLDEPVQFRQAFTRSYKEISRRVHN